MPVLATDWSGHLDFLYKPVKDKKGKRKLRPHFAKIDYTLAPIPEKVVWEGVIQKDSMWAYPEQGSYKMKLREVYKDYSRFKSQSKKLKKWIFENFSDKQQYKKFNSIVLSHLPEKDWMDEIDSIELVS